MPLLRYRATIDVNVGRESGRTGVVIRTGEYVLYDGTNVQVVSSGDSFPNTSLTSAIASGVFVLDVDLGVTTVGTRGVVLAESGGDSTTYDTIAEAIAVASSGDGIFLGAGRFEESFTIPDGVNISGLCRAETIIAGAAATGTRVVMGDGCSMGNLAVELPTDATPAILQSAGESKLCEVFLLGQGGSGIGIQCTGGDMHASAINLIGNCDTPVEVTGGALSIRDFLFESGTVNDFIRILAGTVLVTTAEMNQHVTATDGLHVGAGRIIGGSLIIHNCVNAIHQVDNAAFIELRSARLDGVSNDLLVDPGVTGGVIHLTACEMAENKITAPVAWFEDATYVISMQDEREGDEGFRIWGELQVGLAERGREASIGEGESYVRGVVVLTTDNTAGPAADGGNFLDVSAASASASGSTFSFQGVGANHSILFGSSLSTGLRYWGIKVLQTIAAVEITPRSFVFEVWNGANWVGVGAMATESNLFYRYGSEVFLRADSSEHIRFGITPVESHHFPTNWAQKSINGSTLYWARVRILNTLTTAPVFEQFKISPSRSEINIDGTVTLHGRARFRKTLLLAGNIFGEEAGGGVIDSSLTVGAGGVPAGWLHTVKNCRMNNAGDAIHWQVTLPRGVSTDLPLIIEITYHVPITAGPAVTLIASVLPVEVVSVLVADPTGGIVPVARTVGNTETVVANFAQFKTSAAVVSNDTTRIYQTVFGPFDISNYYEGDMVFFRLEMDSDGGGSDVTVMTAEVSGALWTHGEKA